MIETLILCVPCDAVPNFPEIAAQNRDSYTQSTCDECGGTVWFGVKSALLWNGTTVLKVCAYCAVNNHEVDPAEMIPLTHWKPGKKGTA